MTLRSLLRACDLAPADLGALLRRARAVKADPLGIAPILRGSSVMLYFEKPSTRTRLAFETAVHRLGGAPIKAGPADLQLGRGETIEDTARVVSRYARAVCRAHVQRRHAREVRERGDDPRRERADRRAPSDAEAVADLVTLEERFGDLERVTRPLTSATATTCVTASSKPLALAGATLRVATAAYARPA